MILYPTSPGVEILLIAWEWLIGNKTLHHGALVKVHVNQMSYHAFWAAILCACNNPLFLWVEAVCIRSTTNLIEHSFSNKSGWFLNDHSHFCQMTFLKLKKIRILLSYPQDWAFIEFVSLVYFCVRRHCLISLDPFWHWLIFCRDKVFPELIKWHWSVITETQIVKLWYTAIKILYSREFPWGLDRKVLIQQLFELLILWNDYNFRLNGLSDISHSSIIWISIFNHWWLIHVGNWFFEVRYLPNWLMNWSRSNLNLSTFRFYLSCAFLHLLANLVIKMISRLELEKSYFLLLHRLLWLGSVSLIKINLELESNFDSVIHKVQLSFFFDCCNIMDQMPF